MTLLKQLALESRMIQSSIYFTHHSAKDFGEYLYLTILMLEVLKHDHQFDDILYHYADRTVRYHNYNQFMSYNTDLYNFIYVLFSSNDIDQLKLKKQHESFEYIKHLKTSKSSFFGKIDQYLKNIRNRVHYHLNDRSFLVFIEGYLQISNSSLKNARRIIMDWDRYEWVEKRQSISRLIQTVRLNLVNHDLRPFLEKFAKDNELVMNGLCNLETGENCGNSNLDFIKKIAKVAAKKEIERILGLDENTNDYDSTIFIPENLDIIENSSSGVSCAGNIATNTSSGINNNTIGVGFDTNFMKSIYGKPKKKTKAPIKNHKT